jgi:hypothetical protein
MSWVAGTGSFNTTIFEPALSTIPDASFPRDSDNLKREVTLFFINFGGRSAL